MLVGIRIVLKTFHLSQSQKKRTLQTTLVNFSTNFFGKIEEEKTEKRWPSKLNFSAKIKEKEKKWQKLKEKTRENKTLQTTCVNFSAKNIPPPLRRVQCNKNIPPHLCKKYSSPSLRRVQCNGAGYWKAVSRNLLSSKMSEKSNCGKLPIEKRWQY